MIEGVDGGAKGGASRKDPLEEREREGGGGKGKEESRKEGSEGEGEGKRGLASGGKGRASRGGYRCLCLPTLRYSACGCDRGVPGRRAQPRGKGRARDSWMDEER